MKFLTKILTVAMIAGLGMSPSWANNDKSIAAVEEAYNSYQEAKTSYDSASAAGKRKIKPMVADAADTLSQVCDSKCTRFSCGDEDMAEVCTASCPFIPIKNCVKKIDPKVTTAAKYEMYVQNSGNDLDDNGVPLAPEKPVAKKAKVSKPSVRQRIGNFISGNSSSSVDGVDQEGNSCTCNIKGLTSATIAQPQVGQPIQQMQQSVEQPQQPVQQQMQQPVQQAQPVQQPMQQLVQQAAPVAPQEPVCTPLMRMRKQCQ